MYVRVAEVTSQSSLQFKMLMAFLLKMSFCLET